jgi:hypothetical protein
MPSILPLRTTAVLTVRAVPVFEKRKGKKQIR